VAYIRGNVYFADLGAGEKPWLVVSNNGRNSALGSALVVRITTTVKPSLASIVELEHGEPVVGRVLCDDITVIYDDDQARHAGGLSLAAMTKVAVALKVALAL
jgi:mRNA interferase MazF